MEKHAKIYIAGHNGMVGSAILRRLKKAGYANVIFRSSAGLDLRNSQAVEAFFKEERPDYVFLAAAKVGGIAANDAFRADFIYDNLMIQSNVIHQSYENKVKKLLFLGSSCIYPKEAKQPIREEYLLTGPLEKTNEAYAIAKIAGIKMCESYRKQYNCNFITVMPTNLYGPNDNYDLETSHVLPALLRKFHEAKLLNASNVEVWGTGMPRREFLHVDDLADACLYLMLNYNGSKAVNVGLGKDLSIRELAELIKEIVGYLGDLSFDHSKPDGTLRKLLDVSKLEQIGWKHRISLEEGIREVYKTVEWNKWIINSPSPKV